ncbi:MAG: endolytic transglycosylase MltG [Bacteroidetes bacterium]|nr:endolytic transglycosylase MltG [Bacteroidota bacterium]
MYIKKIFLAVVLIGLLFMCGFAYYVYNNIFISNTAFNNEEAHIYISTDATFSEVIEEIDPLLISIKTFINVAKRKSYDTNVKPGHYIIINGMNNNDIIIALRSNNVPVSVKFNNQERIENLAGQISKQIETDSLSLLNAIREIEFLNKNGLNLETALSIYIPNTYEVYWNISAEGFRDRMLKESIKFWNPDRKQKASNIGLSAGQVMSLAAIVQKETANEDERQRVAGVYLNRIKRGMPLQADPTVIYAKKLMDDDFEQEIKRVLYKDLKIDSPYNTYKNIGMPPGPITMPDISSIDAVLNYEKHSYLFFVADVNNFGYHKFAKTLAQHNRNRREYVRWISQQGIKR